MAALTKTSCKQNQYIYEASIAQNEYEKTLRQERSRLQVSKETIAAINVQVHFYKYIDLGILNVKNIDLQRKVRYRVKKEYDYTRAKTKDNGIKLGRFYRDFQDFLEHNPNASIPLILWLSRFYLTGDLFMSPKYSRN